MSDDRREADADASDSATPTSSSTAAPSAPSAPSATSVSSVSSDDAAATAGGKRRGRPRTGHTVAKVITATLLAIGMATGLSVVFIYRHLNDNLDRVDLADQLRDRPEQGPKGPLNILVMGSDTRTGEGNNIDGMTGVGGRSDTTILFHLSADRESAYAVSVPRDSLVDRPTCYGEDGEEMPGEDDVMWNEAYSVGGPACTIQQFEQLTDIRIDNYVVVDFNGFQDMVDAIGGVEVCIPEDISDPEHDIEIPAGTREIEGLEALNYVRARYTLGDGTDLGRIKRQQAFIGAMAEKVVSGGVLARPDRLVGFLDAATSSLQTDFDSLAGIADVGLSFRGIGLDKIKFVTVPWKYSVSDPGRVEWLPEADQLWRLVKEDAPLSPEFADGVITAGNALDGAEESGGSGGSDGAGESPSGEPSDQPSDDLSEEDAAAREAAGLCA